MDDSEAAGRRAPSLRLKGKKTTAAGGADADANPNPSAARSGKESSSRSQPEAQKIPSEAARPKKTSQPREKAAAVSPKAATIAVARPTNIPEPPSKHGKTVVKLEIADEILSSPEKPPRNEHGHALLATALAEKLPPWAGDVAALKQWSRDQSGGDFELWDSARRAQKLEQARSKARGKAKSH